MRKLLITLAVLVLAAFAALPAQAMEMTGTGTADMSGCSMQDTSGGMMEMTTIKSLRDCVVHCYDMGYIANQGVEAALLKLVDAAQASADTGNTKAAANSLSAFVRLVKAQPTTIVDPMHADCLVMHATMVIQALGG